MSEKIRLAEATDRFLVSLEAQGRAKNTRRNYEGVLRRFLRINGDLFVVNLDGRHIDQHFIAAKATRDLASLGIDHACLARFFGWLVQNRHISRFSNPMEGRKAPPAGRKERNRVTVKDFARLLDAAGEHHPRDRMVVALGLYLFLRPSEIVTLRIGDVSLDAGDVRIFRHKTRQADVLAISADLDRELRAWYTYYSQQQGRLDPRWFLVPSKKSKPMTRDPRTGWLVVAEAQPVLLNPDRPISRIHEIAQRAFEAIGYPTRDENGKPLNEGMHTLRRSAARARFDALETRGYDGAVRHVQTWLGHATMAQTEHYLGLQLDRVKRNELVRGKPMFDTGTNVVPLAPRQEKTGSDG